MKDIQRALYIPAKSALWKYISVMKTADDSKVWHHMHHATFKFNYVRETAQVHSSDDPQSVGSVSLVVRKINLYYWRYNLSKMEVMFFYKTATAVYNFVIYMETVVYLGFGIKGHILKDFL